MKETLAIGIGVAGLLWAGWVLLARYVRGTPRKGGLVLPPDASLKPRPLLTEGELHLYNLIRMAVQDHYLVLARVPLWSLLDIEAEGRTRLALLRYLALKTADFVLVHPGSREVEHIVLLNGEGQHLEDLARHRDIQKAMETAGIKVTTLTLHSRYTVERLAQMLGVGETDQ